jgi:hypothetical protein
VYHYDASAFARNIAEVPWSVIENFDDVDGKLNAFHLLFDPILEQHAPIKRVKPAAHERTCRAYLLFVTSWIDNISSCAGNIYGIFVNRDM